MELAIWEHAEPTFEAKGLMNTSIFHGPSQNMFGLIPQHFQEHFAILF